ncbi:hypothetical protein PoB_000135400 [Plakobranchus ocellatus]|uniref:Uncharacterized protein n=1 Tax=Plakobranchus ocellatus TaxID=259542 RepID=A0AAV3XVF0_9GAST|nr:hypothetical protein PoB_000135400 [Plakobranchus ocellatus]
MASKSALGSAGTLLFGEFKLSTYALAENLRSFCACTKNQTQVPFEISLDVAILVPWGDGGTVNSESALRSSGTLMLQVRAPPPAPWLNGGPQSLT